MKMPLPVGFFGTSAIMLPLPRPDMERHPVPHRDRCPALALGESTLHHRNPRYGPKHKTGTQIVIWTKGTGALALSNFPFVADRGAVTDAYELMARFGEDAGAEAATRADASRNRGNVTSFCRWRQIERMIIALGNPYADGTRH
jgi:hypothetical protein